VNPAVTRFPTTDTYSTYGTEVGERGPFNERGELDESEWAG
jgi:hypothetical protein